MITLHKNNEDGISLQICGSYNARCGILKNEAYFDTQISSNIQKLADWVSQSKQVLSF